MKSPQYFCGRIRSAQTKLEKCTTKEQRLLLVIYSGKPHSELVADNLTGKTSCAAAIGDYVAYSTIKCVTYKSHEKATQVATEFYNSILKELQK